MSESTQSTVNALIDYEQLEPFAEIGFEDFGDIYLGMLQEAPILLEALSASILAGDAVTGRRQAHSLRGMVLNFGCTGLGTRLAWVERSPDFPGGDPSAIVAELKTVWDLSRKELQEWAAAHGGPS